MLPHHAPREYIDRYAGRFDDGWDVWRDATFARQRSCGVVPDGTTLTPRPPWVDAWGDLTGDERRLFARLMECFAGFLTHTDAQLGRLFAFLEDLGVLDDTLVLLCSDNGTSAEGGPYGSLNEHRFTHQRLDDPAETLARLDDLGGIRAYNHYPWGWAWAGNTPLRLWKRYSWLGGVRTPMLARWPGHVSGAGQVRSQFCHAVDVLPTVLDAVGIDAVAVVDGVDQSPLAGASLLSAFADAGSAQPARHAVLRDDRLPRLYQDGWKVTTDHVGNQLDVERDRLEGSRDFDTDRWLLFNLDEDFSEAHDRSAEHPELVRHLEERWWLEAGRNQVLPLDDSLIYRVSAIEPPPYGRRERRRAAARRRPGERERAPAPARRLPARGPPRRADGWGRGRDLRARRLEQRLGLLSPRRAAGGGVQHPRGSGTRATAPDPLAAGRAVVSVRYRRGTSPGGEVTLAVDDTVVAAETLTEDLPFMWQIGGAGLLVGRDRGLPVSDDYDPPFACTAGIRAVVLEAPSAPARATPTRSSPPRSATSSGARHPGRREWDLNPRCPLLDTTVFETAPFGRSGIPPPTILRGHLAGAPRGTAPCERRRRTVRPRRAAKNSVSSVAHSSARTPSTTTSSWLSRGSAPRL